MVTDYESAMNWILKACCVSLSGGSTLMDTENVANEIQQVSIHSKPSHCVVEMRIAGFVSLKEEISSCATAEELSNAMNSLHERADIQAVSN